MYLERPNEMAKIAFYKCPNMFLKVTGLYWEKPVHFDKILDHNRPAMLVIQNKDKKVTNIDIECFLTSNLKKTKMQKKNKLQNITVELLQIW